MKSWELFEAMTDLEDDTILAAAQAVPRRRLKVVSFLRHLTAACLAAAVLVTSLLAFHAEAGGTTMRYTLRIREDGVKYVFWNSPMDPPEQAPCYAPTWLPEEYEMTTNWSSETKNSFIYTNRENDMEHIWFECQYVGDGHQHGYGLDEGTYTRETITIGEIEADHYIENDQDGGWIIWIDRQEQILFHVSYQNGASFEDALRVAESIQKTEGEEI